MTEKNYEIPKTYTVSYFNETEWNKDLTPEEINKNNELSELEYQDRLLNGPQYGPGNTPSKKEWENIGKAVVSGTLAAASVFPLTAPIAVPVTIGLATTGAGIAGVGHLVEDESMKTVGKTMFEIGFNANDYKEELQKPH